MKRAMVLAALCLGGLGVAAVNLWAGPAEKPADKLLFPNVGFSIAPLDEPGEKTTTPLMMCLPPSGDFAANVNVQSQPYTGSLEEYATLSRGQFKQIGAVVKVDRKLDGTTWLFEYTAKMSGRALHFYARAVKKDAKVFLVTATGMESLWPKTGAKLQACVDNFQLLPEAAAPAGK